MILDDGNVLTMDETMPRARALAIAGGRILGGVDSREDAIASHAHERIALEGATVVPGLVDAHVHFRAWALARRRLDLRDAATFDELLDRVAGAVDAAPAGSWVLGQGWDDAVVVDAIAAGEDVPGRLERAAGGRAVALVSHDGHALLATTRALDELGLDLAALEAMDGGAAVADAGGTWAGVLRERAAWAVRERLPEDDLDTAALAAAMREASRRGITCVHDMDGAAGLRSWRTLEVERGLRVRVRQALRPADLEHAEALGIGPGFGSEHLRIVAVKAFLDGTLGSDTALLHDPEVPAGERGMRLLEGEELRALAIRAAQAGLPLWLHAIGDRAVTDAVDALEATQEHWGHLAVRPRIEHVQLSRAEDLARIARLGIGCSVQPSHLVADRDLADARWGVERTARTYAFRAMLDAGCGLLLGSDAPIEQPTPLAQLHAAVHRDGGAHGLPGERRGPWHAEQAITPEEALRASTAWPADALGEGAELGRLLPGRRADLVVLDGDPLTDPVERISVVATMVGGRWVHGSQELRRTG